MRSKWIVRARVAVAVALFVLVGSAQTPPPPMETHVPDQHQMALEFGQKISIAISTITSTAVSPLLGVCVLGAYEYFHTPPESRPKLPTYTKPVFWIPVLALLALILFKDSVGSAAPLLKKPLDAVEVLVLNKASLVLIGFPVVFHEVARILGLDSVARIFALLATAVDPVVYAQDSMSHRADLAGAAFVMIALGLTMTTAVWLVSHAVDVLLLLNPFPLVDLLFKGLRSAIFAVLAALAIFDPRVGMVLSGFVILISLILAGWTFRLAVFGAVFSLDLLRTMVLGWHSEPDCTITGFAARRWNGIPKRGLVRVRKDGDQLVVVYRPFLFGPHRLRQVPAESMEVGRGLFYPQLIHRESAKAVILVLPRYRKQEERLAAALGAAGPVDVRFGRGWHAFFEWAKDDSAPAGPGNR